MCRDSKFRSPERIYKPSVDLCSYFTFIFKRLLSKKEEGNAATGGRRSGTLANRK